MSRQPARAAVIKDVARLAGVSHQTVSRVLNNHDSVRQETRERVLRAVEQLHFRPNALARGLARRRSGAIGVVSFDTLLYGPAATLLGVERAARRVGYGISIVAVERLDRDGLAEAVDQLVAQSVAGLVILAPVTTAVAAVRGLPVGVPAVVLESDQVDGLPSVSVDQRAGAGLAVEHLLGLGHRTVWHLSGQPDWIEARSRIDGWRQSLAAAGRIAPPVISGDWSAQSGYAAGCELAARRDVTAVFCANDQQALGMLRAFRERGVRVPEDVSVVGFDDIPEAAYLSPPLTTVRQDFDEVGRRCLGQLLELLEPGERPGGAGHPAVAPTLVVRASTGPAPARP